MLRWRKIVYLVMNNIVKFALAVIGITLLGLVILFVYGVVDLPSAAEVFAAVLGGILTIYGSYLSSIQEKKGNFKESSIYMNKHYPIVARYATEIENNRFDNNNKDGYASNYTVCHKDWILDNLMKLTEIKVKMNAECFDSLDTVRSEASGDILLTKDNTVELVRPEGKDKKIKPRFHPLFELYDRGRQILPYGFKTFAQNVQLISERNVIPYPSFALTKIESKKEDGKPPELTVCLGDYDDFYNTCVFLLYELTHDVFVNGNHNEILDISEEKKKLQYRKAIKPEEFTNRFASIGINTLTVLKNLPVDYLSDEVLNKDKTIKKDCKKGDFFLMHVRGSAVAEGPGMYHVVPAGSYQPTEIKRDGKTMYMNLDPESTVIKEFAEEVLKEGGSNDLISRGWIESIREKLVCELYYLGIALEPVNLKTEMLSVLVIDVAETNCREVNIVESTRHFGDMVEGAIKIHPLEQRYLEQYRDNMRTAPAGRAIISLFSEKKYDGETLLEKCKTMKLKK